MACSRWGRVDILVCNAGFVRDRTFAKIDFADFQAVLDVHLGGTLNCLKSVWPGMIEQQYGRVVLIGSATGLAGNFGQSAYGTAKMALVGLMNTLGLEGEAKNVRINCFAPAGASRMNEELLKGHQREIFAAEKLRPGIVFLASDGAPNRSILMGGGGSFERAYMMFSRGRLLKSGTAEELADRWEEISDRTDAFVPETIMAQLTNELANIEPD
jgi:NAD(P)-dependent dehydrogenase (short-subunit alcohol dehydrogenase family)